MGRNYVSGVHWDLSWSVVAPREACLSNCDIVVPNVGYVEGSDSNLL